MLRAALDLTLRLGVVVVAVLWTALIIAWWRPRAARRGGRWYLEAILYALPIHAWASTLAATTGGSASELIERCVVVAALACAGMGTIAAIKQPRHNVRGLVLAGTAYCLLVGASAFFGAVPAIRFAYLATPLLAAPFLLSGVYTSDWLLASASRVVRVIAVLSLAAPAFTSSAFWTEDGRTIAGIPRLAGILEHPNGLAGLLAVGLALELARRSRWWWKAPILVGLLLAQSATGFIAALVGWLVVMACRHQTMRWFAWLAAVAAIVTMLVVPSVVTHVVYAFSPEDARTFSGRGRVWAAALYGFRANPAFGYGPTLFDEAYRVTYIGGAAFATHAHNQFVQTIAENGIVGMAGLVILLATLAAYGVRLMNRSSGVVLALLAILLTRMMTETPLKPSGYGLSWFEVALVLGLAASQMSESYDAIHRRRVPPSPTLANRRDSRVGFVAT